MLLDKSMSEALTYQCKSCRTRKRILNQNAHHIHMHIFFPLQLNCASMGSPRASFPSLVRLNATSACNELSRCNTAHQTCWFLFSKVKKKNNSKA